MDKNDEIAAAVVCGGLCFGGAAATLMNLASIWVGFAVLAVIIFPGIAIISGIYERFKKNRQ